MRKLSHAEIVARQVDRMNKPRLPFCAVLNNVRSLYNVGVVFRTADGAGLEKLWLCGHTGYPPQGGIAKTALGAENYVPWEYKEGALDVICRLKEKGYQVVLLEQMHGSIAHDTFIPKPPLCLVIGNEISGISDDLLTMCDAAIEINMAGVKNSLNVAIAFGIAAYQIASCLK